MRKKKTLGAVLYVRMGRDELRELRERAAREGLSLAVWVRRVLVTRSS